MLTFIIVLVLVLGVNTVLWTVVGGLRVARSKIVGRPPRAPGRIRTENVSVLIAAHNEEQVLDGTIRSAQELVPPGNVYVVSDASTDHTAQIARERGANVLELAINRGKAGALAAAISHFDLTERSDVVMVLDADTRLSADYMTTGLPLFDDPDVVAVAGRATTVVDPLPATRFGRFLIAYRERFYVAVQFLLKYGQAARRVNVVSIVPGFASMYRAHALKSIEISAPGLAIEDFNMTFEVHAKKLGRIEFHPGAAIAHTQDPDTFHDYRRQYRRWALGFWQTVRRHGFRLGRFGGALALFVAELITSSVMLLLALPIILVSTGAWVWVMVTAETTGPAWLISQYVPAWAVLLGVFIPDYLLTILAASVTRRPKYLLLGFGFLGIRVVDAAICLCALPAAFRATSTGMWKSPARRTTHTAPQRS
ncbi:glycosyltransferase [Salinibacterium sp. ZJ450]|uniref:glycosyltransferase family 2 protein n=1 Tax=Salinibacterium sp. ZJ450 TaxID=2708338 RepID=UPI0014213D01|nr:glycosyltransferase family 2 protein [Salinibacterium sp. ZJ450]